MPSPDASRLLRPERETRRGAPYDAGMWADRASRLSVVALAFAAPSCRGGEGGATSETPRHAASTTGSTRHVVITNASDPTGDYGHDPAIDMVAGKVVQAPHRIKITITLAHPIDYAAIKPDAGLSFGVLLSGAGARHDFAWVEIGSLNDKTFQIGTLSQERRKRISGSVRGNVIRLVLPRPARDYTRATFLSETALSADSMQ